MLSGIGEVTKRGWHQLGLSPLLAKDGYTHENFLGVRWRESPRDVKFPSIVFPMHTLSETTEDQYRFCENFRAGEKSRKVALVEDVVPPSGTFEFEEYLEEFVVFNFKTIFKGELVLLGDDVENNGQQYNTNAIGIIDILARDAKTVDYVVIELKKDKTSDVVVGQVLRYMGWVKKNSAATAAECAASSSATSRTTSSSTHFR
jgi:restriction system protein